MVALAGVVVHDVEDDLDTGTMQRGDHFLELGNLIALGADRTVGGVRGKESQ